jgi:hypothetical protein
LLIRRKPFISKPPTQFISFHGLKIRVLIPFPADKGVGPARLSDGSETFAESTHESRIAIDFGSFRAGTDPQRPADSFP